MGVQVAKAKATPTHPVNGGGDLLNRKVRLEPKVMQESESGRKMVVPMHTESAGGLASSLTSELRP